MRTFVSDTQRVTGTSATLFEMVQQGPQSALLTIHNAGSITINYTLQEKTGASWESIGSVSTLTADQTKRLHVDSDYPQVRMIGDAAGETSLEFGITRTYDRPSGGSAPIIAL